MDVDINGTKKPLHFNLKRPCAECPFRRSAPMHQGVAADLQKIGEAVKQGIGFVHSCHRTDSRSDYEPAQRYRGKLQHCYGAIVMQVREGIYTNPLVAAWAKGEIDLDNLNDEDVYTFREMLAAYYEWLTGDKLPVDEPPRTVHVARIPEWA